MDTTFYVSIFLMGVLGFIISTAMILRSMKKKAGSNNVIHNTPKDYFKDDWYIAVITFAVIFSGMIAIAYTPQYIFKNDWAKLVSMGLFSLLGYNANDVASRLYSTANQKLNDAIKYKSIISDTETGTLYSPTPAK